jgi:hypothetical protein
MSQPPATCIPSAVTDGTEFPGISLDLLAYDLADMLDRCEYPVDVADTHIRPALAGFLRAMLANADGNPAEQGIPEPDRTGFPGVSLGLLAYDIAEVLEHGEYPIDAGDSDIEAALPGFLRAVLANAAADADSETGAVRAAPMPAGGGYDIIGLPTEDIAAAPARPLPQQGRAPKMTYDRWHRSQGIDLGAATRDEWYWRCPVCRTWAGPYPHGGAAKEPALNHKWDEHDRDAARRTEARLAARRVCPALTSARLDEMTGQLAAATGLSPARIQEAIIHTATAIHGMHSTYHDAAFYTGKTLGPDYCTTYLLPPHPKVRALINAIEDELGHHGWLKGNEDADARR